MNRTTLGRFRILADADLSIAVLNLRSNMQLRASFSATNVAMMTARFGKGMDDASCTVMRCRW
jgi:hypothetical protein